MKMENRFFNWKVWNLVSALSIITMLIFTSGIAEAKTFEVAERPLNVTGYLNQGIGYGIAGDDFDTQEGFQQAVFQGLLEIEYSATNNVTLFTSGILNVDLAYPILSDNNEWKKKEFNESWDELYFLDDPSDYIKECWVTWTPGNFYFRVGKQIEKWGETVGTRLMDQINPVDNRRGFTDLEFETTIIPIWLLKAEYFMNTNSSWMRDLGFDVIFNPNADFITDQSFATGNDAGGIYSPDVMVNLPGIGKARVGSSNIILDKKDKWDEGHEFGIRVKGNINETFFTINYFNGYANAPVTNMAGLPGISIGYDGVPIIHPKMIGTFPRFEFAGFTCATDLQRLRYTPLGGVSPVLRLETFYGFDTSFSAVDKSDEIRWALMVDWKIKANFLNPSGFITISPQFTHQHILDYPSGGITNVEEDSYSLTLLLTTKYFRSRLTPTIIWSRNIAGGEQGDLIKIQTGWEHDNHWNYILGTVLFRNDLMDPFGNKDQVFATIAYRF